MFLYLFSRPRKRARNCITIGLAGIFVGDDQSARTALLHCKRGESLRSIKANMAQFYGQTMDYATIAGKRSAEAMPAEPVWDHAVTHRV